MRRLAALLMGTVLTAAQPLGAAAEPAVASWQPSPEPEAWARVRTRLMRQGPPDGLAPRRWIFLRALDGEDLRAGEYLADLTPTTGEAGSPMATFIGVVLLQRPARGRAWQVRERRMRVHCGEGRLEVLSPEGTWTLYAGSEDPDTAARRSWMCSRVGY